MSKSTCVLISTLLLTSLFCIAQPKDLDLIVFASTDASRIPIALQREADQIILPLILSSKQSNADNRVKDLVQASEDLLDDIDDDSNIRLLEARLGQSAKGARGLPNIEFGKDDSTTVTHYITISPRVKEDDFLLRAEILTKFAEKITLGAVQLEIGKVQLGVKKPEQYRAEIMALILKEMATLRSLAGAGTILHLSGMELPVEVRQIDQKNVELAIRYKLTIEQWGAENPALHPER